MKSSLLFCIWFVTTLLMASPAHGAGRPPNILLILADDLGFETINCYGGTSYKTPQIDALAKSGIRFTDGFSTPLCSPSRVELMTGRYGFRTGWINLIGRGSAEEVNEYFDPQKERTFAHMLKSAGYATAVAGKWQLSEFQKHPDHAKLCGFDESRCWAWLIDGKQTSRYWAPILWENGKQRNMPAEVYGDDIYSDFLIDFMKRHRDKPFFAYYPMALVHAPMVPPPNSRFASEAQAAAKEGRRTGKKAAKKSAEAAEERMNDVSNYPDMVSYMDSIVGKMVKAVEQLGLSENTLILFTGDNGCDKRVTSNWKDLRLKGGKGSVAELGAHVPFIASWKGRLQPGQSSGALINFCDVLPTLAEVSGAKLPNVTLDGKSFAPVLFGKAPTVRDWVFTQLGHKTFARDTRYLLHDDGRLFDVIADIEEKVDLSASGDPKIADSKRKLQRVLDQCKAK